jgi:LysM repeat protein
VIYTGARTKRRRQASLSAHLIAATAEHALLRFHPDCPRCRAERLVGARRGDSLISRRAQAALAAGLLAFSAVAPPAVAQVPEVDPEQQGALEPGGEPPGLQPDLDPGGQDTFDYETAPVPGGPQAGGEEDEGLGGPVERDPTIDPEAPLSTEEQAPSPAPPASSAPAPTPTAPRPAPAPAPTSPPAVPVPAPPTPPPELPAVEPEGAAPHAEPLDTSTKRKTPESGAKTHEAKQHPTIGTNPAPPPETPAQVIESPAAAVQPMTPPAPDVTAPVTQPSGQDLAPIAGPTYTVRPGDSLWSIAERLLGPGASAAEIAHEVDRLWELNKDGIATGDPDLLLVGTELRL